MLVRLFKRSSHYHLQVHAETRFLANSVDRVTFNGVE
ncbi:hypothetical protein Cha6605_4575 [Chamaesiphon minutus PCC 6605]|uniref:Uncharacterized protein n=1 Tax=Chamaesiphon minutus (strain ATCC 27169 / PCC 6605) TaxID=1173020 RepID=K9UMS2_CHAP6|nr:hypothetical protein Cha6605_4575 [Chamaesiphon minutus PCC 6605]